MYFKKLELFGFKSFADRTKIVFERGVTAVVGPNGAGKSNISDAIKWVLGEQSAKELRGGKMEDVIFNGTDSTQPVNIAEVSLTLSNEDRYLPIDYDEITVTRRVFRSGESEYLLNKTQVRLKDIQDLFYGTGIGTSSYSIAEQGKMDRVLSARPEDRREIFEEASGITKYKTRKKEALRKLEQTENNLTRLADIIGEVQRQINSIERQAKRAQRYQEEFEQLKELDIKLSLHKYRYITEQKGAKEKEFTQLKQQQNISSEEMNAYLQNVRNQRQQLSTQDQEISEAKNRLLAIENTIDKNIATIGLNDERIKDISSRRALLASETEQIEAKIISLKQNIGQMQQEQAGLGKIKYEKEDIVRTRQKRLDEISSNLKECEAVISQSKLDIMDNMAKQAKARNEITKFQANILSLSHRHRRLHIEREAAHTEDSAYADKLKEAECALKERIEKTQSYKTQTGQAQEKLQALNRRVSEIDQSIISFEKTLVSSSSKVEILANLEERKDGLPEGVRAYLEMTKESRQAKDSFIGVLADIIDVTPGYERAVEAALGDDLQSIILKDDIAAMAAVDYLTKQQKGKTSFIILDKCSQGPRLFNFDKTPAAQRLDSFISAKETSRQLVSYLFDGIFFAENIEEALSIIKKYKKQDIKVVTKDGSTVTYNRIVGGGIGAPEYTGIVGRRAKIEQLIKEIDGLKNKIEHAKKERLGLAGQIESCQKDLQEKDALLRQEEQKAASKEAEKARLDAEVKKLAEELNLVELELEEVTQQEEELKEKEAELKEQINILESQDSRLQDIISQSQKGIESSAGEKDELLVVLTEARTELSLLSEKYQSQEATFNMLKDSLEKEEFNLENRKKQIEQGKERTESLGAESQRIVQENEILTQQKEQLNIKFSELEQKRYALAEDYEKIEQEAQKRQGLIDEIKTGASSLQLSITELTYEAGSIKDRVYQAYKVNLDETAITFTETENWEVMVQQVDEAKDKIEKMGPVNLVAIEEHKELKERFEFLTSQQQDLLNAKESLHKAINRINRTTRKLFIETFEKIRIYFKDYFRLLFGGGTADIYLIDQADILESGIEITARPPGKKLQNISLLSGGEKALTSIALLFALFKVRPSPFCVLDEIDAPLDEANIDRFSRMLGEFIKVSQFIIITHNKKTISIANVMYGITMEKSGISKIVSVKFAENEIDKQEKEKREIEVKVKDDVADKDKEPTTV